MGTLKDAIQLASDDLGCRPVIFWHDFWLFLIGLKHCKIQTGTVPYSTVPSQTPKQMGYKTYPVKYQVSGRQTTLNATPTANASNIS